MLKKFNEFKDSLNEKKAPMSKTVVTPDGNIISPLAQKYIDMLKGKTHISYREMEALRKFMNNKASKEEIKMVFNAFHENEEGYTLDKDHEEKGYSWLMNQWKGKSGRERKNNPFGYREEHILENFREFRLKDLYDAGNSYVKFYVPLYAVYSTDGDSMEYYVSGGEIHIVG